MGSFFFPMYLMTKLTPEKWRKFSNQFEELWHYPNVCGNVDNKRIRVQQPFHGRSANYNYKNYKN